MPTLFLMVGLPGAGKTTLAKQLEQQHSAVRFTPDEWMLPLFGVSESDGKRWLLESDLFWKVAARLLGLGVNVILDYGLWSREERDDFRRRGEALGASVELHALDLPLSELWKRVEQRNRLHLPDVPIISHADMLEYSQVYQKPSTEELALYRRSDQS